jgi:choline kinase
MKSIILAAGEGTRLRPLTLKIPKCLVKIFGKSFLEWQLNTFHNCNINDIVVITGYLKDLINLPNIRYYNNSNYDKTNMVETLFTAKDELKDSVIISYGDIIFEEHVLKSLINSEEEISVIIDQNWKEYWELRFKNPLDDAESLLLDSNNYITEIGQKVTSYDKIHGQYIGLMKFQGNGINFLKNFYEEKKLDAKNGINPLNPSVPFEKSFMTDLLNGIIKSGKKIKAIQIKNGWLELDSISDYDIYNKLYKNKQLSKFFNVEK